MKRRKFLQHTAAAVSLPVVLNGLGVSVIPRRSWLRTLDEENDRVLVLIQLNGGNDGLNMLVPLDQYDNLANARSNIIIPENSLLPVDDIGFHPAMPGLRSLYDDARMTIVQSVGYPFQNRSHFRSTDIWTSGSPSDEVWTTGWLGRYFDTQAPGFPDGYPNAEFPDPFALTIGSVVTETCQGVGGNFSMAINDPFNLNPLATGGEDEVPNTPYGEELLFLRQAIEQTNAYAEVITQAAESGNNMVDYPEDLALAQALKNVALLISGGLKTKVYVVSIGGFDTHANQVQNGDPLSGTHANLLQTLSTAVSLFMDDLKQLGLDKRVVAMTFSEFGRRIRSNSSLGTDHGDAAPLLVFGSCINPGVIGSNPVIPPDVSINSGVEMQYDFRDVYGSVLMDWFGVAKEEVKNLLYDGFTYIPILNVCENETFPKATIPPPVPLVGNPNGSTTVMDMVAYPNPFGSRATVSFFSEGGNVELSLLDAQGRTVRTLMSGQIADGYQEVVINGALLPPGTYVVRLNQNGTQQSKRLVKVR